MFKRKSNLPATPSPLSFSDILSDLTRLQTYNQQQIAKSIESSSDPSSLIDHLLTASSSAITSIPQETLDSTYNLCTNFIRVNDQLLVSRKDFNGLGLEIKGLKKELNSMIETLEKYEVNNYNLEEEDVVHEEDI
ncbi:581_t:CDS:2 [Diversispora eburnea]|uniref:581_t:CDS:1 n=1 Tax=Diversispora eburnea TaxID=1213867 RepID=A0A9N8W8J1_9GLOM|nr:581_t:CDS:2 [Diversispora eburnea]